MIVWSSEQDGENEINLAYNDVKCGFEMLHEIGLALEKCQANQI